MSRSRSRSRSPDDKPDRPLYVGNFEYEAEERDVRELIDRYAEVVRMDMKQGYSFVYLKSKKDGDYAIRKLDGMEWGRKRRPLKLQWAKQREADRKRETKPTNTLFCVNFDVNRIRTRDIERHFEPYGRLKRVEIKRNYAFVQFDTVDDAMYALKKTDGTMLEGRTVSVEFVQNEHDPFRDRDAGFGGGGRGYSPRGRSRSPPRRRSPSPRGRSRSRSPVRRRSPSPVRRRSPSPARRSSRSPPRRYSRSPPRRSPTPPPRGRSPAPRSRSRSRSPGGARGRSYSR